MQNMNSIRICEISKEADLKTVECLAGKIFPETYRELLSPEQIAYMMHMMYDDSVLKEEFAHGMHFALICDGDSPVGYVSWHFAERDGKTAVKLEKLYLDFPYHHRGIGGMALHFVIETARKAGASAVFLNVNKENGRARKAYLRAGFSLYCSEKNPIGNGYFMDDYVMKCGVDGAAGEARQS